MGKGLWLRQLKGTGRRLQVCHLEDHSRKENSKEGGKRASRKGYHEYDQGLQVEKGQRIFSKAEDRKRRLRDSEGRI